MRIRYQLAISLDGFIAPEDGSLDWLTPFGAVAMEHFGAFMKEIGGVIMGRATYDQQAAMGGAGMYGDMPVLIMTSRPLAPTAPSTIVAKGDPAPAVAELKSRIKKGDIWLLGGGATAARLLDAKLIDTIELTTVPVALGAGRSLLAGARAVPQTFERASSRAGKLGTVETIYRRAM